MKRQVLRVESVEAVHQLIERALESTEDVSGQQERKVCTMDCEPLFRQQAMNSGVLSLRSNAEADQIPKFLQWSGFQKNGRLFGREKEISQLQTCYSSRFDRNDTGSTRRRPELVLVAGPSGTGKTVLVEHALQPLVTAKDAYFLYGKFDQLHQQKAVVLAEPYGPFVAALTQLALALENQETPCSRRGIQKEAQRQIGMEAAQVLVALVPALGRLLGIGDPSDEHGMHDDSDRSRRQAQSVSLLQQERLKTAIVKLFGVVCTQTGKPVVLVLDDLQWSWSDGGSLRLLETLIAPPEGDLDTLRRLMVLGVCRSNEVDWHHSFATLLRNLEDLQNTKIHHIRVQNLTLEATSDLIFDLLQQPPGPLAEILYERTEGGNPFFLIHLLKTLLQSRTLVPTLKSSYHGEGHPQEWCWDDCQWKIMTHGDSQWNVVDLVAQEIQQLPPHCQRLLKTLASIGAEVDYQIIVTVLGTTMEVAVIQKALEAATTAHIVVEQLPHRPGRYAFTHDRFQEAALSLVPEQHQSLMHLSIGLTLFHRLLDWELKQHMFLVVNQLYYGASHLACEEDKIGLADLCSRAGRKAARACDFDSARVYYDMGVSLLPQRRWRDEYRLCLNLFCSRADAECCASDFEAMEATIEEILSNCRGDNDKLRCLQTRIFSYGLRSEFQKAVDQGLEVLAGLGERFPSNPTIVHVVPPLVEVKLRLTAFSDEDLLALPKQDFYDTQMNAKTSILSALATHAFCAAPELFPLIVLRAVKMALRYGLNEYSSLAFAGYGFIMCATEDYSEGSRYARLALELLELFPITPGHIVARVNAVAIGMIGGWGRPQMGTLVHVQQAVQLACQSSDVEAAMFTAYLWIAHGTVAGVKLALLDAGIRQYVGLMSKQGPWLGLTMLKKQFVDSFIGRADGYVLSFEQTQREKLSAPDFEFYTYTYWVSQLQLAYHFGDAQLAMKSAKKCRKVITDAAKAFIYVTVFYLYDALAVLEVARRSKSTWYKRRSLAWAQKMLSRLTKLAKLSPDNVLHKVHILQGELESEKGNLAAAIRYYKLAADSAIENEFEHMQALAIDRAAAALRRFQEIDESQKMAKRAIHLYHEWGATAIAVHLLQALEVPQPN